MAECVAYFERLTSLTFIWGNFKEWGNSTSHM